MTNVSSLPDAWVTRIWAVMRGVYGATFDRQWECPADKTPADHVAELKAIWGRELRGYQQNPKAIAHALDHLPPDFPPNLLQFAALCRTASMFTPKLLEEEKPWQKPAPEVVQKVVEGISRERNGGPREWITHLQARVDAGDRLTITQREMLARAQGVLT